MVKQYLNFLANHNYSPKTLKQVIATLSSFQNVLTTSARHHLLELNSRDIEHFIEYLQDHHTKPNTINSYLSCLSGFYQYLAQEQLHPYNPVGRRHRVQSPQPLPRALSEQEYRRLIAQISSPRDRAMFLLLLRAGIRIGELVALTLNDLNLEAQEITIPLGHKNRRGRLVYFSNDTRQALEAYLAIRPCVLSQALFISKRQGALSTRMVERLFKNYAQCAGLNPQYTPHCLRHSFATSLLNAGAELITIQHLLGHDHIQITQLYARLSNQKKKQAYFAAMSRLENTNFEEVEDVITG